MNDAARCDLCDGEVLELLVDEGPENCRLVLCASCALVQAAPGLEADPLDAFYDDVFSFDHGSRLRAAGVLPDPGRLANEERLVTEWALPVLERFDAVADRRVLDLRCRSGALTAAIAARAAEVVALEPFEANVRYAREVRSLDEVRVLPFSRFHDLPLKELGVEVGDGFDTINVLAHHVLAHVLSPRVLLQNVFRALRPGGLLLLDEKDVLHPWRYKTRSPFDTGRAHQFHLTRETVRSYLQATGFELLACDIDAERRTDFAHVLAVGRKPADAPDPATRVGSPVTDAQRVQRTRDRLRALERSWWLRAAWHRRRHKLSKRWSRRARGRADASC